MAWHLAPALKQLRAEVDAKWPNRSKASDGTIGDTAHSARLSDHNPNGRGSVNAVDITASGIDTGTLIAVAKRHPSVRYIIHNRRIMNRDIGNFASRPYGGSNPHIKHVHISLYQSSAAENRTSSWGLANAKAVSGVGSSGPTWTAVSGKTPTVRQGNKGEPVKRIQKAVGVKVDGYFGAATKAAVMDFQRKYGLGVDGIVGKATWSKINAGKKAKPKAPRKAQKAPKFPLPRGHWYGVESSSKKNHSGHWAKDRAGIKKLQSKLKKRGWRLSVDGRFGAKTKSIVVAFQKEKGLKPDGLVGLKTWRKIWESPVTS